MEKVLLLSKSFSIFSALSIFTLILNLILIWFSFDVVFQRPFFELFFVRLSFFTLTIKRVIFNLLLHAKVEGGGSLLLIHSVRIPQVSSPIWRCEKYFSLVTELRICFLLYLFLFHSASSFLLNFVFQLTQLMSGA